jgi:ABC-type bacteriocin/lantibiotic exporter with double-glycine peptidase domain
MVAEYYAVSCTEARLLPLCGTTLDGTTPVGLAHTAQQLGLSATLAFGDLTLVQAALNRQQPVIVFLGLPAPPPSLEVAIHAVVVTAIDSENITFIDPADGMEHTRDRATFLTDWQRAFGINILITRP